MKLLLISIAILFAPLANAQSNVKPWVISTTIGDQHHSFYKAKASLKNVQVINKFGGKYSIATVTLAGTIEGNLCLDKYVALDIDKNHNINNNGKPYHYEQSSIKFVTYRRYFRKDRILAGSTMMYGCTAIGILQPFVAPLTFEAAAGGENVEVKSAVFDVVVPRQYGQGYKFRVSYNKKTGQWSVSDL